MIDKPLYLFRGAQRWLNGNYKEYKAVANQERATILKK
ncbi:MAG: hypothetical protein ACJATQ_001140 [Cellvibrionaceae bacterium]